MKTYFQLIFYRACLRETQERKIKGEKHLELAIRFFQFKIYQLSKKKKEKKRNEKYNTMDTVTNSSTKIKTFNI